MKNVVIYHNLACGTSRNTLALIRNAGIEPEVIEYLHNPPTRTRLLELIAAAGLTVSQVLREKAPPYEELKLSDPALTDAQLLDAISLHPILINRPLVVTDKGVRLCRPADITHPQNSLRKDRNNTLRSLRSISH
jgi:arsenate reductase